MSECRHDCVCPIGCFPDEAALFDRLKDDGNAPGIAFSPKTNERVLYWVSPKRPESIEYFTLRRWPDQLPVCTCDLVAVDTLAGMFKRVYGVMTKATEDK